MHGRSGDPSCSHLGFLKNSPVIILDHFGGQGHPSSHLGFIKGIPRAILDLFWRVSTATKKQRDRPCMHGRARSPSWNHTGTTKRFAETFSTYCEKTKRAPMHARTVWRFVLVSHHILQNDEFLTRQAMKPLVVFCNGNTRIVFSTASCCVFSL